MEKQKTLGREVSYEGVGLFTGEKVRVVIRPAALDHGIVFVRKDLAAARVPADVANLLEVPRRTSVGAGGAEVHTIEHLMAALGAFGVHNAEIEIDGPEIPAGDGSALPYALLIEEAGVTELDGDAAPFVVREQVSVDGNGATLCVLPQPGGLKISYSLHYPGTAIGSQFLAFTVSPKAFLDEIAPARTFCLLQEVEALRSMGLGKGATTQNTLVVGDQGVVENTLRFPDEFVRHKILDLVGDLALLGGPLRGHIVAMGSGHAQNHRLAKGLRDRVPARDRPGRRMMVQEIQRFLPHRYPFLMVDRLLELEERKRAVGLKNVTTNEPFFQGHFPGRPVMPGVLQVEAIAQVAAMMLLTLPEYHGKMAILSSLEDVRFRRPVVPGDQLILEATMTKIRRRFGEVHGRALVEGELATEAVIRFAIVDLEDFGSGRPAKEG